MLNIYGMVVPAFSIEDQANQVRLFEKIFLMANVRPEIVLRMFFLTLNDVDIDFLRRKFQ